MITYRTRRPRNKSKIKILVLLIILSVPGITLLGVFISIIATFSSKVIPAMNELNRSNIANNSCIEKTFKNSTSEIDADNDGVDDFTDILNSAKSRIGIDTAYVDEYYSINNGKPPEGKGVCTDVFWRALDGSGYDFRALLISDMNSNLSKYPIHIWSQTGLNPNIDFRRVPNIEAYLDSHATKHTTEVKKCDFENLSEWQAGDIVIFNLDGMGPNDHIAIVSDKRNEDGVPYLIHNWGRGTIEDQNWYGNVVGHYRWKG